MPCIRLDKFLSGQGACSRKEAREYVLEGLVTVNGKVAASPAVKLDTDADAVCLNSKKITYKKYVYYMMNKPGGVVSASSSPKETTIIDLLPKEMVRPGLFPAGRLDKDTEGLLIITDDGEFAHRMLAPKKHVEKTYFVRLDSPVSKDACAAFQDGIVLEDGYKCLPAKLHMLGNSSSEINVTIHEGKYHQIKRMFKCLGKTVVYLKRISIGGLNLDENLEPGLCKIMAKEEIAKISE